MNPVKWVNLLDNAYNGQTMICPECGGNVKADLYARVADGEKRGFINFECEKCGKKVHFSRVKFPDYAETKDF